MRPGAVVSVVGHIGFALMTTLAWQASAPLVATMGNVVPVEIVDVALESNVRALAVETEEDETPAPAEEANAAEEEVEPTPAPAPSRQRQRAREDDFDLSRLQAGLLDKQKQPGRQRQEGARSDRSQAGAGLGTEERASLEDRVFALARAHIQRCWRMPADLPDPERLVVTVEFDLNRNGTLNGQPRVTSPRNYTFDPPMRIAADAALRAVRLCDPFPYPDDPVVGEHYEIWREQRLNFGVQGLN